MRCIVIDVGNTSTGIARYDQGRVVSATHVRGGIRTAPEACAVAVRKAAVGGVNGAILGSVVPAVNTAWRRLIRRELGCHLMLVKSDLVMDIKVDYPHPETIGADRLANACGGVVRYGAPLVVADFGTAVTFDIVTRDRHYVGGVIAPGLPLMTDYLFERTALVPRVALGGRCPKIGRSTETAVRIGAQVGYRGMVREIVAYLGQSLGRRVHLVATGGYARWVLKGSGLAFTIDPTLTLFGLGRIFDLGQKTESPEGTA